MKKIIRPPEYLESDPSPLIFLAGPIQGALDWQSEAIETIQNLSAQMYIASPRRLGTYEGDFSDEMYHEQTDWEKHHLRLAGENGTVMFWLAKEHKHLCNRSYAQTTRWELSEWKLKHQMYGSNLVIGIESGFSGAKYIRKRVGEECIKVKILDNLEETCKEAVRLALNY